jgi:hypothetical protein
MTGYKRPPARPAGGPERPPLTRANGSDTRERADNEPT